VGELLKKEKIEKYKELIDEDGCGEKSSNWECRRRVGKFQRYNPEDIGGVWTEKS
jgi:hypothetical protein